MVIRVFLTPRIKITLSAIKRMDGSRKTQDKNLLTRVSVRQRKVYTIKWKI